jgi:hypothetical protein
MFKLTLGSPIKVPFFSNKALIFPNSIAAFSSKGIISIGAKNSARARLFCVFRSRYRTYDLLIKKFL